MDIAALILSVIALLCSASCLVIMLAKNYFSSHQVQMVPVGGDPISSEIGRDMFDSFKDIGDPLTDTEKEELELRRQKLNKHLKGL